MDEGIVNCPNCEKHIGCIDYIEYGTLVWTDEMWKKVSPRASEEYFCPYCKYSFTDAELVKLGVMI